MDTSTWPVTHPVPTSRRSDFLGACPRGPSLSCPPSRPRHRRHGRRRGHRQLRRRPDPSPSRQRRERRRGRPPEPPGAPWAGKSDPIDAVEAARAALSGGPRDWQDTKRQRGGIRVLRVARRSARKERVRAINQLRSLVSTAPEELRSELRGLSISRLVHKTAGLRPNGRHRRGERQQTGHALPRPASARHRSRGGRDRRRAASTGGPDRT